MSKRLNMIPLEHPPVFDWFKAGLENFWKPQEIAMGYDKTQYETALSPELRNIVKTNLANLTTADVEIMDNVHDGISTALEREGFLNSPELRMALNTQAFQESLHTFSYQHILESYGMTLEEQEEFYNLWQTRPEMKTKVDFALEVTYDLHTDTVTYTYPEKLAAMLAFYWLFYEGGWFWSGFNVNWAITAHHRDTGGKPLLYGTSEQLVYIARDESQHIALGTYVVQQVAAKRGIDEKWLRQVIHKVAEHETAYARMLLPEPILGYNADQHSMFVKYIMNIRWQQMGLTSTVPFPDITANPSPWRSQFEMKQEKNFFETRVTEYRVGADLGWDAVDKDDHFGSVM